MSRGPAHETLTARPVPVAAGAERDVARRAVIAGGSLAGLATGLTLGAIGWRADVFEGSVGAMEDRGAGIVLQPEVAHLLRHHADTDPAALSVPVDARQYLDRLGRVVARARLPQSMTSWEALYLALAAAFPAERYHVGERLVDVHPDGRVARATFATGWSEQADVLVGADGIRSSVRRRLVPDARPVYAGYVAWRGVVEEADLDPDLVRLLVGRFTLFEEPGTQMLAYAIPGREGSVLAGERRVNWVWYRTVDPHDLPALLTDRDGRARVLSLPPGRVRPEVVSAQAALADRLLPSPFRRLFDATADPFVQAIHDLAVPRMAFGRAALVGDAAFLLRPHTAASTAKAAADAIALARALSEHGDAPVALKRWQRAQLALGWGLHRAGRALGERLGLGRRAVRA